MTGVIWIIQVVHYPLFARVGVAGYAAYQTAHMRLITWVVGPVMLLELVSGVGWWWFGGGGVALLDLGALALIWASTALLQVPAHERLLERFEPGAHRRLVGTNWIRTILWSGRGFGLFYLAGGL